MRSWREYTVEHTFLSKKSAAALISFEEQQHKGNILLADLKLKRSLGKVERP
jgi:hypothetical protein